MAMLNRSDDVLAARSITKRHAFGISSGSYGCLQWLDESTLVYPVGMSVTAHHLLSNTQKFFAVNSGCTGVTALAMSSNKKFVAIAEAGVPAQIHIFDTTTRKKRKTLTMPSLGSDRYVALDFSADGRHLVSQAGAPSWNLLYWNWERSKPLANVFIGTDSSSSARTWSTGGGTMSLADDVNVNLVTHVSMNPNDPLQIAVTGCGVLRFYRYADGVLNMTSTGYGRELAEVFMTHCWVSERRLLVSTESGNVLFIEDGAYQSTLTLTDPTSPVGAPLYFTSMTPFKKGFVGGTSTQSVAVCCSNDSAERFHVAHVVRTNKSLISEYSATLGPVSANTPSLFDSDVIIGAGEQRSSLSAAGGGLAIPGQNGSPSDQGIGGTAATSGGDESNAVSQRSVATNEANFGSFEDLLHVQLKVLTENDPSSWDPEQTPALSEGARAGDTSQQTRGNQGGHRGTVLQQTGDQSRGRDGTTQQQQPSVSPARRPVGGVGGNVNPLLQSSCRVCSMVLNQSQDCLAVAMSDGTIHGLAFGVDWSKPIASDVSLAFEPICQPFHTGAVVGMSCCVRRPLLVTSSTDNTVRIWNTETNTLDLMKRFDSEPGAVAIHPHGLQLVVCFFDKVRVMNVMWNGLSELRALSLRGVTEVRYAIGGQFFAMAHGNVIQVYRSATCDVHGQLRGHTQKIRNIQWCSSAPYPLDDRIVSCANDGLILEWNVRAMQKENERADKRYHYCAVASDDKMLWAVGLPERTLTDVGWKVTLREFERKQRTSNVATNFELVDSDIRSLLVASQRRVLIGGCADGTVKLMTFPLEGSIRDAPQLVHGAAVTQMTLSFDESTLFTAAADGSIFIFDIREEGRTVRREYQYGTEVLATPADIENCTTTVESLQQHIENLKTDLDGQEERHNHEHGTRIRERTEELNKEAATTSSETAALRTAKVEQEQTFVIMKQKKETESRGAIDSMEATKQVELEALEVACSALRAELETNEVGFSSELQHMKEAAEEEKRARAVEYEKAVALQQMSFEKLQRQMARAQKTNDEARTQLELDTDTEIEATRQQHNDELTKLRERYFHMKGESAIMRKNVGRLQQDIDALDGEVRMLDVRRGRFQATIKDLTGKVQQLHRETDDREVQIGGKEKQLYDLKKHNQDLEKHKFVQDHRIRQLKSQIEPKQMEIAKGVSHIKQKDADLETYHRTNLTLRERIEEIKADWSAQQERIKLNQKKINDFVTYKSRVVTDIGAFGSCLHDPEQLRSTVDEQFDRHVIRRGGQRAPELEEELKDELTAHNVFLAKTVQALRRKIKQDQSRQREEASGMMVENMALIREIHELRYVVQQIRDLIAVQENVEAAKQRTLAASAPAGRMGNSRNRYNKASTPTPGTTRGVGSSGLPGIHAGSASSKFSFSASNYTLKKQDEAKTSRSHENASPSLSTTLPLVGTNRQKKARDNSLWGDCAHGCCNAKYGYGVDRKPNPRP